MNTYEDKYEVINWLFKCIVTNSVLGSKSKNEIWEKVDFAQPLRVEVRQVDFFLNL